MPSESRTCKPTCTTRLSNHTEGVIKTARTEAAAAGATEYDADTLILPTLDWMEALAPATDAAAILAVQLLLPDCTVVFRKAVVGSDTD